MRCPKCRKGKLVLDASQAELYCQRCGTVVEEKLADPKTSLFEFDPENVQGARRPTRQPTSWLYPYKDLGTGRKYRASAVEESYARAVGDFQPIWGQLRLPMHVRVYSALLWRRCYREGITRGRAVNGMAAAVARAAYLDMGIRINKKLLSDAVNVPLKTVDNYYAVVTEKLGLRETPLRLETVALIFATVGLLDIDIAISGVAIGRMDKIIKRGGLGRRGSRVLAAAAVYLAAKNTRVRVGQASVASALGISERGLRRAFKT